MYRKIYYIVTSYLILIGDRQNLIIVNFGQFILSFCSFSMVSVDNQHLNLLKIKSTLHDLSGKCWITMQSTATKLHELL